MNYKIEKNETLHRRWLKNAEAYPDRDAIIFWKTGEEPFRWTFSSLMKASEKYIRFLVDAGIKPGEVCAIIIRHHQDFYPLYIAVSRIGAIPSVLAYPNPRLHPDKFRQGLEGMSQRSGLDWILTELSLEKSVQPLVSKEGSTIKGIFYPLDIDPDLEGNKSSKTYKKIFMREESENDPLLLQHSSGTTGLQKPVLLSHKAVLKHAVNYAQAIGLNEHDKIVSWLPLYHDMGLIAAFHIPLALGIPSVQIDTFEWVMIPSILLDAIFKEKGTVCWLPNFAYNMMTDKIRDEEIEGISLKSLRLLINCSEPVRFESHSRFTKRFAPYGFNPRALSACYAMAETTYAVTQTPPGKQPKVIFADRQELSNGKLKLSNDRTSRYCVSSGTLIDGCDIKIINDLCEEVPEGNVGEIVISSESMFDGYRNYPEKTAEVLRDNLYYSGDFGFKYQDEFYVIGRKKDIIIVAGNNIYPEDVEDAISSIEGVIPGRVVAFGEFDPVIGSEQVSIIAETNYIRDDEKKKLKLEIIKCGMSIDVTIRNVYLVPARWLIKSSAGKPSRKANMERILKPELNGVVNVVTQA
jgi:fatty-acyl-CoA synthase